MTLLRNGPAKILLFVILFLLLILVVLNIYLGGKLRKLAPAYMDKFSQTSGLYLQADEAGLDPLFRIRLTGVKASDPSTPQRGLAEIGSLTVDPGIISSILSGRMMIKEIIIDGPYVRYDSGSIKRILDEIKGGEGGSERAAVGIEKIRLNDASIELSPDVIIALDHLTVRIRERGRESGTMADISGNAALFGNGMAVEGVINVKSSGTTGKFRLVADKTQPGSVPESLISARKLRGIAEVSFNAANTIQSNGVISVLPLDNENGSSGGELAKLDYALEYDRGKDTARVDKIGFDVMNVVNGVLAGEVKDVTGGLTFDLRGKASSGNLKVISAHVPELNPSTLIGTIRSDDLRVEGNAGRRGVRLTGNIALDGIGFAFSDKSLGISGLDCGLDINQSLDGDSGFGFSSRGRCKVDEFFQKDAGVIKDLGALVDIESGGLFMKNAFSLSEITGSYMGGTVSGSLGISTESGEAALRGTLRGQGLDLAKAPKSILPFDMGGTAGSLSADIDGKPGAYKASIAFSVSDFIVRSETGREFKVSGARTTAPLDLEYTENAPGEGAEGSTGEARREIFIKDKGLSYQNLSFGEYRIESGSVEDLLFTLVPEGEWNLGMASRGAGFQILGMDTGLSQFKEHINITESGRRGFSGTIEGTDGKFRSITFPALSAEYVFHGDRIDISKLSAEVSPAGVLKTDDLSIGFGSGKGGYPYKITLKEGKFSGYEGNLTAEGIAGSFTVNNPEAGQKFWEGTASAAKADIFSAVVEGLRLDAAPLPDGIVLRDITGKFINGNLKGKMEILTSDPTTRIVTDLGLENASMKSGGLDIAIGRAGFNFSGALGGYSLPQGTGKFSFSGLSMKSEGLDVLYGGAVGTRTSDETLFLEDGFIRSKDNADLRFTGEMENTAGGDRDLRLAIPDIKMTSAIGFMSPFLPPVIRGGKVSGNAGLTLKIRNVFSPGRTWSGVVSFYRASFAANMGGADLSLRGINGTVNLRDEGEGGNALSSLLDDKLTLDKELYNEYFRALKESAPDGGIDHIRVDGIEYGILKFENLDCALVADTKKLAIRKLSADIFGGRIFSSGVLRFGEGGGLYNFSFLFNDISLGAISKRLSPTEEYITGRVNGLVWLTGEGGQLGTIDGPFEFWSVSSQKEPRSIGKALLDKLGAKERFVLGSSRSYDNGEISGYINDGVITFKKFNISNSVLGIKNLSIQADPVKNSISISHLVSVIREIARRSQSGGPTIETQ